MKKQLKIAKAGSEDIIANIVEKTFTKLSYRMSGVGMYDELKNAISEAYKLGKAKRKRLKDQQVIELKPLNVMNAQ